MKDKKEGVKEIPLVIDTEEFAVSTNVAPWNIRFFLSNSSFSRQ
jgi:hypothetical protein